MHLSSIVFELGRETGEGKRVEGGRKCKKKKIFRSFFFLNLLYKLWRKNMYVVLVT